MEGLVYWLLSGSEFCFFLFGLVLLVKPSEFQFRRRLLGASMIIFAWYTFLGQMILSKEIVDYFFLLKSGSPFYYLVPPFIFLYVRDAYNGGKGLKKYDWLHFLPAILTFIDLFPYIFLGDPSVKQIEIAAFLKDPSALIKIGNGLFIPSIIHYDLTSIHGIVYMFFTWKIIMRNWGMKLSQDHGAKFIASFFTFFYCGHVLMVFAMRKESKWYEFYKLDTPYDYIFLILIVGLMALCLFLLSQPTILNPGITAEQPVPTPASTIRPELRPDLSKAFLDEFLPRLQDLMDNTQIFRQPGVTIIDVAQKLGVAPHLLSSVLNKHYNQRFSDFINQRRIEYVIHLIKYDPNWKQYTIEGLSSRAGFSSRAPFYAAFKKITGKTPSEYTHHLGK